MKLSHLLPWTGLQVFLLLAFILLSGCSLKLNDEVRVDAAKAQVAQIEGALTATQAQLTVVKAQLAEARKIAEETKSEAAITVVAQLQRTAAIAEAAIPHLEDTLALANKSLADIEASGGDTVSLWKLAALTALPFLPRLIALIPGVGAFAAPLALGLGNIAHRLLVTPTQRKEDELVYQQAAALPDQVAVTNQALAALSATDQERIKEAARKAQEQAGTYAVLRPLVLAAESGLTAAHGARVHA